MRRGGSEARNGVRREDREVRVKTATDGRGIVVVIIVELIVIVNNVLLARVLIVIPVI